MSRQFLPVFSLNRFSLLIKLKDVEGEFGILATTSCSDNFLTNLRHIGKPYFIDSGVFEKQNCPWYYQIDCKFEDNRWLRELRLADEQQLRQAMKSFLDRSTAVIANDSCL